MHANRPIAGTVAPITSTVSIWAACTWAIAAVTGIALIVLTALSPRFPIYDEGWFLSTLDLLRRHGLSTQFLREFPGAAGPTFTLVFAAIDRVTGLSFPWLRLLNIGLLLASIVLIWRILKSTPSLPPSSPGAALISASLIALPTTAVSAGMALTELPAAFFAVAAVFMLTLAKSPDAKPVPAWLAVIVCSVATAAAVLGRQNYLGMLPCLLLAFDWPPQRRDVARIAAIVAVVLTIAGPVFFLWGGLVPPRSATNSDGLSLANGIKSAGYAGLIAFLFAPEIFGVLARRKVLLAAACVLSVPVALMLDAAVPMASVTRILSAQAASAMAAGFRFALAFSAICFIGCFALHIWRERANWLTRFAGSTALLGILSNARITHQFSSRYVFVFLPFIVLALAPAVRMSWHQPLRLAIGACISLGALASYYNSGQ